ncbi:MAG: DegT/DnrJ/EryC1/StrS family aminotransferase [Symploca sp. SIO3E6]|nr:DegT/DnrJ/EryC1/StrS family aminotransferase [Caldora sp. SIO3E6]
MSKAKFLSIRLQTSTKQILTVSKAILKKQISRYPAFLEDFEQRFARYTDKQYGLSFCNGTSAIEASMFAANIGEGDEVIVPSCTFHASIDPILNLGATPVFADVDQSFTICPVDIAKKITPRTKAIVVVHLFGIPANMGSILEVIKGRNITLIEDASHAHGARWGDRLCGGIGDFGAFSLQGSKTVAGGEGGIVVTNDFSDYIRMSMWGHFNRHAELFSKIDADEFYFTGVGYKRRMHPISALLADADLDHLESVNQIKRKYASILDRELAEIKGIEVAKPSPEAVRGSFYQGYPIRVTRENVSAEQAITALKSVGIAAIPYPFALHHKLPVYTDKVFRQALIRQQPVENVTPSPFLLPVTENLKEQLLLLSPKYLISLDKKSLKQLKNTLKSL